MKSTPRFRFPELSRSVWAVPSLLLLFISGSVFAGELRIWTSQAGTTLEARMVALNNGRITLADETGKEYTFPLEALTEEDRQVANRLIGQRNAPAASASAHLKVIHQARFDARLNRGGILQVHPKDPEGNSTGKPITIRPRVIRTHRSRELLQVIRISEFTVDADNPESVSFTGHTDEENPYSLRVNYVFEENRIQMTVAMTSHTRKSDAVEADLFISIDGAEGIPPNLPERERIRLLSPYSLVLNRQGTRPQTLSFHEPTTGTRPFDTAEVRGLWAPRVVTLEADNRREGNRLWLFVYGGGPLQDGFHLIRSVEAHATPGTVTLSFGN